MTGNSSPNMESKKRIALSVIDEACATHGCAKVFALFSGGDDSLAALRVAVEHPNFVAAVHCNTDIGVEATRVFVRDTCKALRCPLIEYEAAGNTDAKGRPDPQVYEQMVMEYGFPGPTKFGHGRMYVRLKDRSIRRLLRDHARRGEQVVLAAGCRADESQRRMGTTKRIQRGEVGRDGTVREKNRVWVNHLFDWSKPDVLAFSAQAGLSRNPVSALIGKSGECLCGAYAKEGELEQLLSHDLTRPVGRYLLDLERRVIAAGFPWRWHEGPPRWWLEEAQGQGFLFEMSKYDTPGPLCAKCERLASTGG